MPREPNAKQIGRIAKNYFSANIPLNWLVTSLDGDEDYGLDYLIQYKNQSNDITYNFFVQLKGIEDQKKITDEYITIKLKSHTLNYYQNNGLILIVACDINTKEYYYQYLHTILYELYGNKRYFDNSEKEYSIPIPKSQKLDHLLNIEPVLKSYARGNYTNQREHAVRTECDIVTIYEDTKIDYETKQYINGNSFLYQKGRVHVDAYIPNDNNFSISMLIMFKITDLEKAMITPSEEEILKVLFTGYQSKANSKARKWNVGQYKDNFILQISHVRLDVPAKVLIDLSDILDRLFEIYCERIQLFEQNLKARLFQPSKIYRDGYKLIKIKRGLWYYIHKFAKKYGFQEGNSEWHIFGSDNYSLRVYLKEKTFIWSGSIIISPELDDSYMNYKSIDDEVILSWNSLPDEEYERKNAESKILDIEDTRKWLIERLIPKVVYEFEMEQIEAKWYDKLLRINRIIDFKEFLKSFDIHKYVISDYRYEDASCYELDKRKYLYQLVLELQSFYHSEDDVFLNIESLSNLYEGLVILLKNAQKVDLHYLLGNLGNIDFQSDYSVEGMIGAINRYLEELSSATTNDFMIDLILRCYFALVEDNIQNFDENIIKQTTDKLKPIISLKENLEIKKKMLKRL